MTEETKRNGRSVFAWLTLAVAIVWSSIWNGLATVFPKALLDPGAGPILGAIFGLIAGGAGYWRRSRGRTLTPVLIGIVIWFVAFAIFVVAGVDSAPAAARSAPPAAAPETVQSAVPVPEPVAPAAPVPEAAAPAAPVVPIVESWQGKEPGRLLLAPYEYYVLNDPDDWQYTWADFLPGPLPYMLKDDEMGLVYVGPAGAQPDIRDIYDNYVLNRLEVNVDFEPCSCSQPWVAVVIPRYQGYDRRKISITLVNPPGR